MIESKLDTNLSEKTHNAQKKVAQMAGRDAELVAVATIAFGTGKQVGEARAMADAKKTRTTEAQI